MRAFDHPSGLRVEIDRARCVCSENCARIAPNTFETDAQGLVDLLAIGVDSAQALREAAASCPVGAIALTTITGAAGE